MDSNSRLSKRQLCCGKSEKQKKWSQNGKASWQKGSYFMSKMLLRMSMLLQWLTKIWIIRRVITQFKDRQGQQPLQACVLDHFPDKVARLLWVFPAVLTVLCVVVFLFFFTTTSAKLPLSKSWIPVQCERFSKNLIHV